MTFLNGCLYDNNLADSSSLSGLNTSLTPDGSFLNYNGNRAQATLNKANTLRFVELLYPTVAFTSKPYTQTSASTSGALSGLIKHPRAIVAATLAQTLEIQVSREDSGIYDFKHCLYSGTAKQSGLTQIGTNYTFTNCQQFQNLSLDGEVKLVKQKTTNENAHKLSFNNLVIHDDKKTYHYSGSIETFISEGTQVIEANVQRIDLAANTQQYFKDLAWSDGKIDRLEGRVYDGKNGFVELKSSEDLALDVSGIPTKGRLYLHGKDYGDAFLGKPEDNYYGSIHIEIDEEGDGFNEFKIGKNVIYKPT